MQTERKTIIRIFLPCILLIGVSAPADVFAQKTMVTLKAKVTKISGENVSISIGASNGVRPKMQFEIYGKGESVSLPLTGETIFFREKIIGRVTIMTVREEEATGIFEPVDGSVTRPDPGAWAISNAVEVESNQPPVINAFTAAAPGGATTTGIPVTLKADTLDVENDRIFYTWKCSGGRLALDHTMIPENIWYPPLKAATYSIDLQIRDRHNTGAARTLQISAQGQQKNHAKPFKLKRELIVNPVSSNHFRTAGSIAFDGRGNLYVWDSERDRIRSFSPNLMRRKDVKIDNVSGEVHMEIHHDVLYLILTSRGEVRAYDLSGRRKTTFGRPGEENGQLRRPSDVARNSKGEVFVVDPERVDIQLFSPNGQFILRLGRRGAGDGAFERPIAAACDHKDNLYVLDGAKGYIQVFGPDFRFLYKFSLGAKENQYTKMALDPDRNMIYALDAENCYVYCFDLKGTPKRKFGSRGKRFGQFIRPRGLAVDPFGAVYVCDESEKFIQRYTMDGKLYGKWGGHDFRYCEKLAASAQGILYLLDKRTMEVVGVDHNGWTITRFGGGGREKGKFSEFGDIGLDGDGNVHVLDVAQSSIQKFSPRGKFLIRYGKNGRQKGEIYDAQDFFMQSDHAFVLNWLREESVKPFDKNGKALDLPRHGFGNIPGPICLAADQNGTVFIYSRDKRKIYYFQSAAASGKSYGERSSDKPGSFYKVSDMEISPLGYLFVADISRRDIQVFEFDGNTIQYLSKIKHPKTERPIDIASDAYGALYVLDGAEHRLYQFTQ